eukprot:scaffold3223_cov115-Isochrysis_galbana.AAC.6
MLTPCLRSARFWAGVAACCLPHCDGPSHSSPSRHRAALSPSLHAPWPAAPAATLRRMDASKPMKQAASVFVFACTTSTSSAWMVAAAALASSTTPEPCVSALAASVPTMASAPTMASPMPTRLMALPMKSALRAAEAADLPVHLSGLRRMRLARRV